MSHRLLPSVASILACGVPVATAQGPIDSAAVVTSVVEWLRLDPATGAAARRECAAFIAGSGSTHQALAEDSAGYASQVHRCQRVVDGQAATSWHWFVVPTDGWTTRVAEQLGERAEPRAPGIRVHCQWARNVTGRARGYAVRVEVVLRGLDKGTATFTLNCVREANGRLSGYTRSAELALERLSDGAWVARLEGWVIS